MEHVKPTTINETNIPALLKNLPQWVCWKYRTRDGKSTKVPYNAATGRRARSNDRRTWTTFGHAWEAFSRGQYDGIGFVLAAENGIVGGDLDNCIDAETGALHEWAESIVESVNTYTEITPSGAGLRFFAAGTLPASGRKCGDIEVYNHGRFLTITGNQWPGSPDSIEERQAAIDELHQKYFGQEPEPQAASNGSSNGSAPARNGSSRQFDQQGDHERFMAMLAGKNGEKVRRLWDGDWRSDYSSQSEADSALCFHLAFWFERDAQAVDRMFRQSGLMREKWDVVHHSSGQTYGQRTAAVACEMTSETYTPPKPLPVGFLRGSAARDYIRGDDTGDGSLGESTSDADGEAEADPETDVRHPYSIKAGRIYFAIEKTTRQGSDTSYNVVCDLVAHITEEITTEEGERFFKIEGRAAPHRGTRGRRFEFEIGADEFADEKRLKASLTMAAGAQSPVRKGMAGHLAPAIQLLTGDLIQARRFGRTGWLADGGRECSHFLIPGREPEHATIELPRKLPYSIDTAARLPDGLEALAALLRAQKTPLAIVASTIAFQAPLAALCGWRNERYAVFIAGRTGSLKSSWTQVLMALYGPGFMNDDQLIKWGEGATRNAIMNFATHAHDMPMLLDNYKPSTGGGERDFVNLIHNILEGGEKDRLTRSSQMRPSRPVFAWPIVTGEDVPDSDAASLARVLVVPFPFPGGNDNPELTKAQALSGHLCAVGSAWLEWLQSEAAAPVIADVAARFPDRRTGWMARLRRLRPDMVNLNRVASNLASNELTWQAMMECPALTDTLRPFRQEQTEGLSIVAGEMATQTAQSLEASRYLSALRELLASEKCILVSRNLNISDRDQDRVIGWEDDDGAYLLPRIARAAVERLLGPNGLGGISEQTLYKQLDSLGAIVTQGENRMTRTIRVGGGVQRVLHLPPDLLSGKEDDL